MNEFAIYRGEEILVIGTAEECAKHLKVKKDTISFYASPAYARRFEKAKNPEKCLIAFRLYD